MTGLGLWPRLIGGLVIAALLASAAWLIKDRFHQKDLADAAKACARSAATQTEPLVKCAPDIARQLGQARQQLICESALLPSLGPETRFIASQACGQGTLRLIAERDAALADSASLRAALDQAQAGTARAVARAETRARQTTERDDHAAKVIADAPRDSAGRIVCDAECLRAIAQ